MRCSSLAYGGGADLRNPVARRESNRVVQVALAAIILASCVVMTAAFPPAMLLVGGLVVTALFLQCLYGCGWSLASGRAVCTRRRYLNAPDITYVPDPSRYPWRGANWRGRVQNVSQRGAPPCGAGGSYPPNSKEYGPLGSEYNRSSPPQRNSWWFLIFSVHDC